MPQVLWTKYFLEDQGYQMGKSRLFQDNRSCMLFCKNGIASSSKRTRHINIKYFFVHDRILAGDLEVEHCPTDDMWGDYMTKPLQGKKFRRFSAMIMGRATPADCMATPTPRSVLDLVEPSEGVLDLVEPSVGDDRGPTSPTGTSETKASPDGPATNRKILEGARACVHWGKVYIRHFAKTI